MKKRNYLSVAVKYFANDAIASIQIPMNEAESVAAQAEEHKDLRFHVTGDDGESLVVIPWEKVASVSITYNTTEVTAPHDTICGDCKHPGAYLKLKDGVTFCYYTDADTGDMRANMYLNGNLVEAPYSEEALAQVCELTLDCEPLVAKEGDVISFEGSPDDEAVVITFYAGDGEGHKATTTAVAPEPC